MKLSRTVAYALHATLLLAESGGQRPVPCSRLAAEGQMPERFLLQILRSLVTHGVLESTRGVDGGYSLSRTPEQISLLDVIEAVDGPLSADISIGEGLGADSQARISAALQQIAETSREQLSAIKLTALMNSTGH